MANVKRIQVAVLGATGIVGQRFLALLEHHPWFEVAALAGSSLRQGKHYGEAVTWRLPEAPPPAVLDLPLLAPDAEFDTPIVFSALPAAVAEEIEPVLASRGHAVFSNAGSHRMAADVPLLIPEVNPDHLRLLETQRATRHWSGLLITNPNCSTIQLALALKPLAEAFGVRRVQVTTLQAISGAGYPGVAAYDIVDNVVPFIAEEEEKIERETRKILGTYREGAILPADFSVSAQCTRVPVRDGHLACVSVELVGAIGASSRSESDGRIAESDLERVWSQFQAEPQRTKLPTAPASPIIVRDEPDRPQPVRDRYAGRGMSITIGRVRQCAVLGHKFVVLGHNTIRGAAGASILNAELLYQRGLL
jgi:aspartate-semialdehyde dehydrogenase